MGVLAKQARSFFLQCRASRLSCRIPRSSQGPGRRAFASESEAATRKPYYITSPIFYVNAAPHAGHLYTLVLTDILKRWQKLCGDQGAILLTGTDEHGMKIQKAAQIANVEVKSFCDRHAQQFENLAQRADIDYDRFMRTTDPDHKAAVEHFWRELNHRGYIYESSHEGWYSVSDETFYPESQVHLVLEPQTGRKMHASMETGKEVEWTSETNYHFKLSEFKDRLLQHYRENPTFIVPSQRMNFIIKEVEAGLTDLSVSRPATRLTWGIRVPNDESQTIYVWLDALINYLTMTGYPFATTEASTALWPPNCQVIGKDIIRFHCIYWPAFLMALDLPLPKQFLSHAHWTMNREKMSKSSGNVVNPFFAIDRFDTDVMRYYMAHDGGIVDDADYDNAYIIERYKKQLQGGFGNLLSRIVRSKKWNVRDAVKQAETDTKDEYKDPSLGLPSSIMSEREYGERLVTAAEQQDLIERTASVAARKMAELDPRGAVKEIMELIFTTNKYLQHTIVWDLAKLEDEASQLRVKRIVYRCSESIRIASILLQPFMPTKMSLALDWLGVDKSKRTFEHAKPRADFTYGKPLVDVGSAGVGGTLFPPLSSEH